MEFLHEFYNIVHIYIEETLKPKEYTAKTYVMYEKGDTASEMYYTEILQKDDIKPTYTIYTAINRFLPWESSVSVYKNDEPIGEYKNLSKLTVIPVPDDKDPVYYVKF